MNIEKLINECKKYIPLDGRILVHPLKIRQLKQKDYSFDLANTKANEGKDPKKHRVDLQKIQPKINAKYQEAVVLQVPFDENRFKVGDTIIYPIGALNDFDLVKGVSMLRKYDAAAVVQDYGINEGCDDERYAIEMAELPVEGTLNYSTQLEGFTSTTTSKA